MYKGIVKELAEKYNESQKLIDIMIKIGINEGETLENTINLIEMYFNKKVNL